MRAGRLQSISRTTPVAVFYAALVVCSAPSLAFSEAPGKPAPSPARRIFAPYIFVGLPNPGLPALSTATGTRFFTIAFVVSSSSGCEASWFDGRLLSQENSLGSEIISLRQAGGDAIISFGGANGTELAAACSDASALQVQYQAVIDKYQIRMLDFDIEPPALLDPVSVDRRNQAIAGLQAARASLLVSYTLPVTPEGLTTQGVSLLKNAGARGVRVDTVNIMTMDYGEPAVAGVMGKTAITAANGALRQMKVMGMDAGLGITPMIGMNDTAPEIFTLADAKQVSSFSRSNRSIRRLSMWSVGRDQPCSSPAAATSPTCSGVAQQPYEFSHILAKFP
jgi:hypothetical protein